MSQILKQIYAGDTSIIIYTTLHIQLPNGVNLRYVQDFEDQMLGGQLYLASPIDVALPDKSKGGAQSLRFAVGVLDDTYLETIYDALDTGNTCYVTAATWLDTDRSTPAWRTPTMVVQGGTINHRNELQIDCVYHDILNTAWPRERYTIDKAPGVKYL